jgi:uncharacterized membrane protein YfcA
LCTVWGILNVILTAAFVLNGRFDSSSLLAVACLAPALPVGILVGEWMHGRVNERLFRLAILVLLMVVGVTLIF